MRVTASFIYDLVPIGSIVAWSDGTPRPPQRHRKKLSTWQSNNNRGRMIRKEGARAGGTHGLPSAFTILEGDLEAKGIIVVKILRTFSIASNLNFTVIERPKIGSIRVFDRPGPGAELVHLAPSKADAELWLKSHGHPRAVFDEVTADEIAALTDGKVAA